MRRFLNRMVSGQGQAAFNPLSLSWELLLDSRQIPVVADGAAVTNWPDLSGHGRTANPVPGQGPKYRTASSPTGLPLADFGPVATGRQMTGVLPALPISNANGFSFYGWYKIDTLPSAGGGDGQMLLMMPNGSSFQFLVSAFVGVGDMRPAAITSAGTVRGGAASLGVHTLSCICNPPAGAGACHLYQDGILVATGTWQTAPQDLYLVSGNAVQNVPLDGKAGFVGFGARADSDNVRQQMEAYLRRTWG